MYQDIWTVTNKELKEYISHGGSGRRGKWSYIFYFAFFGIFLPLQGGLQGIQIGLPAIIAAWLPFLLVSNVIADSFAGERERKTLETLLATRLSDQAILFGKILSAILYGVIISQLTVLVGLITVNIAFFSGQFLLYPLVSLGGSFLGSFLTAGLAAGLGIIISLRAATARQAAQSMGMVTMLLFLPFYLIPTVDFSQQQDLLQIMVRIGPTNLLTLFFAAFAILDIGLIVAARARFKRARLILD